MMTHQFKSGEVVRQVAGGPRMQVVEINVSGDIVCRWVDGQGKGAKHKAGVFAPASLMPFKLRAIAAG